MYHIVSNCDIRESSFYLPSGPAVFILKTLVAYHWYRLRTPLAVRLVWVNKAGRQAGQALEMFIWIRIE